MRFIYQHHHHRHSNPIRYRNEQRVSRTMLFNFNFWISLITASRHSHAKQCALSSSNFLFSFSVASSALHIHTSMEQSINARMDRIFINSIVSFFYFIQRYSIRLNFHHYLSLSSVFAHHCPPFRFVVVLLCFNSQVEELNILWGFKLKELFGYKAFKV